jgi:quinol monooxygenase YgiN
MALGVRQQRLGERMSNTVVFVCYAALPDRIEEALAAIDALISTVQALEPDCIGITMLQDTSDPTRITLVEQWTSQQVFVGPHMQQPHIQSFIQSAATFLSGPPEITFWRPVTGAQQSYMDSSRK